MGENSVTVDPDALRLLAEHVIGCADRIAALRCPTLDAGELSGAAVSAIAGPDLVTDRLVDLGAKLRGWADALASTGRSFGDAESRGADGIGRA